MSLSPYVSQPLMLSSVERMAFYLSEDPGKGRVGGINSDTPQQRRTRANLITWAQTISTSFENYLNRELLIGERTEYFDVINGGLTYFVRAVPVIEFLSVQNDATGQFSGSEWTLTHGQDYYLSSTGNNLQIWFDLLIPVARGLKVTYVGGLAYHAVNSTFTVSGVTGADNVVPGRYAYGDTSEAIGKVVSYNDTTKALVLESINGIFMAGESLTFQSAIYAQDIATTGATILTIDRQSLVEQFPDLNQAMQIELRYMNKHQMNFEDTSAGGVQGSTYRHTEGDYRPYTFQPETLGILNRYRRFLVGS